MNWKRFLWKKLGNWLLIPATKWYLSRVRNVKIGKISLKIPTGVFHPSLFLSTKFLSQWLDMQHLMDFKVLELGAGSGFLAIKMAKMGAEVTASDISKLACKTIKENAETNQVSIEIIESDLFDNFKKTSLDLILINPPYYPKNAKNDIEKAWFCGENFEYFQKLFAQLRIFLSENGKAIMVLSEDCEIERIHKIASKNNLNWLQISSKKSWGEWNFLFEITEAKL